MASASYPQSRPNVTTHLQGLEKDLDGCSVCIDRCPATAHTLENIATKGRVLRLDIQSDGFPTKKPSTETLLLSTVQQLERRQHYL